MSLLFWHIEDKLRDSSCKDDYIITACDVIKAVNSLQHSKRDGFYGLSSDHILYACDDLYVHIAIQFSSLVSHGVATDDLAFSTMITIPKGNNSSRTVSDNYRAISLGSVFGKIFDRILLNRYIDILDTSNLQFGFKKKHSTAMCSLVLKGTIDYYRANRSTTYSVMLDATKAFDRVQYCKLFRKLIDRKLPLVIIRFLLNM